MTEVEKQKLSFPDCAVKDMHFDITNRVVKIKTNGGYLAINGGTSLKFCKLIVKDWLTMNVALYRAKTKKWEKLSLDNIENLLDICEFVYGKKIIFRGFGSRTGQWIEIVFSGATLDVEYLL